MKFFVPGKTIAKGSTLAFLHNKSGKVITRQGNAKTLYPWQSTIGFFADQAGIALTQEPVIVSLKFTLARPKKPTAFYPKRPDLDKLVRAVLDALTGLAYYDDSQVQIISAAKMYETDCDPLGVWIEVKEV